MKKLKEFKTIFNELKKYKFRLIIIVIFIFLTSLSVILDGVLNGAAIEAITKLNLKLAIIYLVIYFIECVFFNIIDHVITYNIRKIKINVTRKMSFLLYKKSLNLPAYAYEERKTGEFINRINNDTQTIIGSLDELLRTFSRMASLLVIFIYVFLNSYIVAIEIVIFIIIYYFISKHYNPLLKSIQKKKNELMDEYTSLTSESIRGVREIKTLGIKNYLYKKIDKIGDMVVSSNMREAKVEKSYDNVAAVFSSLLEVGVFITCMILLYYGKITMTFFIAMTYFVYRFMHVIESITSISKTYNKMVVSVLRINEILENKLYKDVSFGDKNLIDSKGLVEFKNVKFGYPNEDIILNDFSALFESNKKIAIVGKSGQGKTTLFNLITRIFDPIDGKIEIDGIDTRELTEESLRKNVSIIRQDPFLFNQTIKENFQIIDENLTLDEIRKFCELAYIDDYIMSLPDKYDSIIGEGGVNLSGGQKQRLSIVRALAKKSKIILFDEATSALDNESQSYIKKLIDDLVRDHTVIIIAHRLSTIKNADIIYVIDEGRVVDKGTHEELLKNSKVYNRLYMEEE